MRAFNMDTIAGRSIVHRRRVSRQTGINESETQWCGIDGQTQYLSFDHLKTSSTSTVSSISNRLQQEAKLTTHPRCINIICRKKDATQRRQESFTSP
jgi:hypothetical protein